MIDLIPGHGWADIAGVLALVTIAFAVFLAGMVAICGRVDPS